MSEWISVKDRLPELYDTWVDWDGHYYSNRCLVTFLGAADHKPYTADETAIYCDDGEWYWDAETEGKATVQITAWQPLPEPYKGDKE